MRDEIEFNWIYPQDIPAEKVLNNGFGVCMQKANLFSALAREAGFTTRFHFTYVSKKALEDFLPSYAYKKWPDPFPHTITEIKIADKWVSFDPSFDLQLYNICLAKGLNFAKYPEIKSQIPLTFSIEGVKGAQQFHEDSSIDGFYGNDLSPLLNYEKENVTFFKKILKPLIFRQAKTIMDKIRNDGPPESE